MSKERDSQLHLDLPRGTRSTRLSGSMADAGFEDSEKILKVPGMKHGEGKLFLGLLEADVREERNSVTQRVTRAAIGGHAIGLDDDRHIITVAGSRSGKGVAAIIPNL